MTDYVAKPASIDDLRAVLRRRLPVPALAMLV